MSEWLRRGEPSRGAGLDALLAALLAPEGHLGNAAPIEAALVGGARAQSLGGAFLAGYRAALAALVPSLGPQAKVCFCVTEVGGVHPRAIATTLSDEGSVSYLSGHKKWITGGGLADTLLVFARTGDVVDGRIATRLCRVDARDPGVRVVPLPDLPFVPEIPHAEVHLARARVSEVLPGDGWEDYVKPFRSVEDLHVHSAILAWVFTISRKSGWPADACERLLAQLLGAYALAAANPRLPATHLALAGLLDGMRQLLESVEAHWALVEPALRDAWQRDRRLLEVAGRARQERLSRARAALGGSHA